jgi:hypothetical protein
LRGGDRDGRRRRTERPPGWTDVPTGAHLRASLRHTSIRCICSKAEVVDSG